MKVTDPAEIRAEGRRLREACESPVNSDPTWITATDVFGKWVWENLDVLLADPAPVGLTEDERRWLVATTTDLVNGYSDDVHWARPTITRLLAIIDRLSAAPVDDR